jgi:hypothetical protein
MAYNSTMACQTAFHLETVDRGFDFCYPNLGYLEKIPSRQYPRGPGTWIVNLALVVLGCRLNILSDFLGTRSGFLLPMSKRHLQHRGP